MIIAITAVILLLCCCGFLVFMYYVGGDWLLETAAPGALPRHAALTMARSAWGLLDGAVAQSRALQSQEPMLAAARVLPVLLRAGASLDRPAPRD